MGVIGQITGIFGTMYYEKNLKDIEVRTLIYYSTWVSLVSSLCSYALAMRWNKQLNISDGLFIVLTDTIFGIITQAMNLLPTLALFAKITPTKIEGTVFAFLTGTTNMASSVISPLVGVYLNDKFTHVTAENLSNYKLLCLIGIVSSFLGFLIIPLIPLKTQIESYQQERELLEKAAKQAEINNKLERIGDSLIRQPYMRNKNLKNITGRQPSSEQNPNETKGDENDQLEEDQPLLPSYKRQKSAEYHQRNQE